MAATNLTRTCSIDGCEAPYYSLSYCRRHYRQLKRHGDPLGGYTRNGAPLEFIRSVVGDAPEDCVLWPFGPSGKHGCMSFEGRRIGAHRLALVLYSGWEPDGMLALHGPCNNAACVNPRHLSWGTHKDNMQDRFRDGTAPLGEKVVQSKLTAAQVVEIRSLKGLSQSQIADRYGVNQVQIGRIINRKSWKHIA